ncbi:hypothetical protein FZEAL_10870 [Fusarium zealandicum]|uniref:Uncharacterized protein n=1 Tax=Fusarium zealandicum TaxID=1053134 RepID=A0A8H4X830_9HYPO|nr:hypothetical protein FZEAL_10870 [Fusarium zealandicum]
MRESIKAVRSKVESEPAPPLPLKDASVFKDDELQITDEEYQALIEQAIQQSMAGDAPFSQESVIAELDSMDTGGRLPPHNEQNDAELKHAIEASKNAPPLPPRDDDELDRAIAASKEALEKETSQRTEEDVVMEYIKKQSLAEEEYRQKMAKGKDKSSEENDNEDEELRRAMEESLKMSGGDRSGPSGA